MRICSITSKFLKPKTMSWLNNMRSPIEFEKRYAASMQSVKKTRGDSLKRID